MVELAVIADDLTGANDTGVQFSKRGLQTKILFTGVQLKSSYLEGDVIVLNSESRALAPAKAYEAVFSIAKELRSSGILNVLKKIDSTMRGNIGPEIDAMMDAFNLKISLVVPAFPKIGRITLNGKHYVSGVPLGESEIAYDPACPVKESYLPDLLKKQSKRKVEWISIIDVKKGKRHLAEKINHLSLEETDKIIVIDAATDEELEIIAGAVHLVKEPVLLAGSAGIAAHLYNVDREKKLALQAAVPHYGSRRRLPILIVAGSVTSITSRQVQELTKKAGVNRIVFSPEKLLNNKQYSQELVQVVQAGQEALEKGDIVVTTKRGHEAVERVRAAQHERSITNVEAGRIIAQFMGEAASRLLKKREIGGMILTGGDIAEAVCKKLTGTGIQVIGEVESGIPYGRLIGGEFEGLPLVTKAGAFGTEQALVKALYMLPGLKKETCL